jgi:hypothetical protein
MNTFKDFLNESNEIKVSGRELPKFFKNVKAIEAFHKKEQYLKNILVAAFKQKSGNTVTIVDSQGITINIDNLESMQIKFKNVLVDQNDGRGDQP